MGRTKGAKNKINSFVYNDKSETIKRGRGRPRKNTIIKTKEITGNKKDIKQEIKRLKKLKLQCRAGDKQRILLHRQIKELKEKLNTIQVNITPEKTELINKILSKKPLNYKELNIDLTVYTMEELQKHYKLLTEKGSRL